MIKIPRSGVVIILSTALTLASFGCSRGSLPENNPPIAASPTPTTTESPATPDPSPSITSISQPPLDPTPSNEIYEQALDKASSAATISQSAQSLEDWKLVVIQWNAAIALMREVPKTSPYKGLAQTKILEYQRNLLDAKERTSQIAQQKPENVPAPVPAVVTPLPLPPAKPAPPPVVSLPSQQVFQVPIKRRAGGTPVIEVTFNGNQTFEMILDTGASGTVITQQMARALGVVPVTKAIANTASAKGVEFGVGYVDSVAVGGLVVKDVPVAIAGPDLEIGLLGHDFFRDCDITIKRDAIELHPR